VGDPLTGHEKVRMVSLTGSIATGEHIIGHTASSIKRTHMELGGKAPVIVFDDADLDAVVEGSVPLVFTTPGRIVPPPVAFMPNKGFTMRWLRNWVPRWLA
jgi:aminobutyraldehyde dehydrogenase